MLMKLLFVYFVFLDVEMDSDVNETAFSCISSQAKRAKLERVFLDV
jgi:hypothetical protein